MAGAQAIILAELEKEFGGSAEAAGKTFGGRVGHSDTRRSVTSKRTSAGAVAYPRHPAPDVGAEAGEHGGRLCAITRSRCWFRPSAIS